MLFTNDRKSMQFWLIVQLQCSTYSHIGTYVIIAIVPNVNFVQVKNLDDCDFSVNLKYCFKNQPQYCFPAAVAEMAFLIFHLTCKFTVDLSTLLNRTIIPHYHLYSSPICRQVFLLHEGCKFSEDHVLSYIISSYILQNMLYYARLRFLIVYQ